MILRSLTIRRLGNQLKLFLGHGLHFYHGKCNVFEFIFNDLELSQETSEPEVLQPEHSIDYVWDDLTLPRRLIVQINGNYFLLLLGIPKIA